VLLTFKIRHHNRILRVPPVRDVLADGAGAADAGLSNGENVTFIRLSNRHAQRKYLRWSTILYVGLSSSLPDEPTNESTLKSSSGSILLKNFFEGTF
jgi:hypothetical protein